MELRNFADHRCKVHTLLSLKIGLLWFFRDIFYSRSMGSKWFETVKILTTVDVLCFHLIVSFRFSPGETKMWVAVRENGDFLHLQFE